MDGLQPGNLFAQLYVAIQLDRIKRQFDFLYVAPIQKVLDLGIGEENIRNTEADLRVGNIANLLLRLLPISRFAFGKFTGQLAEQFAGLLRFAALLQVQRPVPQDLGVGRFGLGGLGVGTIRHVEVAFLLEGLGQVQPGGRFAGVEADGRGEVIPGLVVHAKRLQHAGHIAFQESRHV